MLYFKIIFKASYIKRQNKNVKNRHSIAKMVKINDFTLFDKHKLKEAIWYFFINNFLLSFRKLTIKNDYIEYLWFNKLIPFFFRINILIE